MTEGRPKRPAFGMPFRFGAYSGADRDRTDDLLNAIQALSQLSYSPIGILRLATTPRTVNGRSRAAPAALADPAAGRYKAGRATPAHPGRLRHAGRAAAP